MNDESGDQARRVDLLFLSEGMFPLDMWKCLVLVCEFLYNIVKHDSSMWGFSSARSIPFCPCLLCRFLALHDISVVWVRWRKSWYLGLVQTQMMRQGWQILALCFYTKRSNRAVQRKSIDRRAPQLCYQATRVR